jgi:NAD-dependent deacetylase
MKDMIRKAAQMIAERGAGVALTGAGISAESGISTYRDSGGLWDRYGEGASGGILEVLMSRPKEAPMILGEFFSKLLKARPNQGHLALKDLERLGYLKAVITQNIDNLHHKAGSSVVYELHGNIFRLRCLQCGLREPQDDDAFESLGKRLTEAAGVSFDAIISSLPQCRCTGRMRPDFVGFGEPVQDLDNAMRESSACGWMLIVGTSGIVHPAASLPIVAKRNGAVLIEVNPKESDLSSIADVTLRGTAGEVLPRLVGSVAELCS